jgi:small-conductance mechanosensitive channel
MKDLSPLDFQLAGNALHDWLTAAGVAVIIVLGSILVKRLLVRRLTKVAHRTATRIDDVILETLDRTRIWLVAVIAVSAGLEMLDLPHKTISIFIKAATVAVFVQLGIWGAGLLEGWVKRSQLRADHRAEASSSLSALSFIGRLVLWALILMLTLENLGVNVNALVTSLGITGIAVALAVQNILGDLFASLVIVIDKPFEVGDFIVVDAYVGTVEHVGIKTTRIRSVDGEQIVFSSGDLLKARVRNYKRMYERRVVLTVGVSKDLSPDDLRKLPQQLREVIEGQQKTRFERGHLTQVNAGGAQFEVVYWVLDPDTHFYMDTQQAVRLAILSKLGREKVTSL